MPPEPSTTNVLLIGGDFMVVPTPEVLADETAPISRFWRMGKALADAGYSVVMRECEESGKQAPVTLSDLKKADIIICYSYGVASTWDLKEGQDIGLKKGIIIMAGVGDKAKGQYKEFGLWHVPENFAYGFCFDVGDSPLSSTIKNPGTVDINFGETWSPAHRFVNIHCDNLFGPIMWPGTKHAGIKEIPAVLNMIVSLTTFLSQVARAS